MNGPSKQLEREIAAIEQDSADGLLTNEAGQRMIRELLRDYRDAAEDAAMEAYKQELDQW